MIHPPPPSGISARTKTIACAYLPHRGLPESIRQTSHQRDSSADIIVFAPIASCLIEHKSLDLFLFAPFGPYLMRQSVAACP